MKKDEKLVLWTERLKAFQASGQMHIGVRPHKEKINISKEFINKTRWIIWASITENDHSDSYGRECLTELTKALEDYRDDLVVIVAGYTEPMKKFFDSNPGLKSRFNTFIEFEDYSVDELDDILVGMCVNNDYELSEDAKACAHSYLNNKVETKEDNFANGRMVRNLYEDLVMNHARRVFNINAPSKADLKTILDVDFKFDSDVKTD